MYRRIVCNLQCYSACIVNKCNTSNFRRKKPVLKPRAMARKIQRKQQELAIGANQVLEFFAPSSASLAPIASYSIFYRILATTEHTYKSEESLRNRKSRQER